MQVSGVGRNSLSSRPSQALVPTLAGRVSSGLKVCSELPVHLEGPVYFQPYRDSLGKTQAFEEGHRCWSQPARASHYSFSDV